MKRYIVKKIVYAKSIVDAIEKEKKIQPEDVVLDADYLEAAGVGYDTGRK